MSYLNSTVEFDVTPAIFLGGFDIYDREEDLGELLNEFNPNDPSDLQKLFDEHFFKNRHPSLEFTIEHKKIITKSLENTLMEKDHDFASYLESRDDDCFYLPTQWEINNPKHFFIQAYIGIIRNWGEELKACNIKLLNLNELVPK